MVRHDSKSVRHRMDRQSKEIKTFNPSAVILLAAGNSRQTVNQTDIKSISGPFPECSRFVIPERRGLQN